LTALPEKAAAPPAPPPSDPNSQAWQHVKHRRRPRHLILAGLLAVGVVLVLLVMPPFMRASLLRVAAANPVLLGLPVVFSLVALSLLWSVGQQVDSWVFLTFNLRGVRPIWLDWVMLGITQLGSGYILPVLVLLLWVVPEQGLAYDVVLGSLTLWLLVELVKALVGRSRPSVRLTQTRIVGFKQPGRSFPSGHTSQIFFLITLLVQHFGLGGWAVVGLYVLAVLVAITRMYVGAHYPRDVLAGATLGLLWGLLGGVIDFRALGGIR
jgi:membrane-associated phospholipid phosphatase